MPFNKQNASTQVLHFNPVGQIKFQEQQIQPIIHQTLAGKVLPSGFFLFQRFFRTYVTGVGTSQFNLIAFFRVHNFNLNPRVTVMELRGFFHYSYLTLKFSIVSSSTSLYVNFLYDSTTTNQESRTMHFKHLRSDLL